ncbi:MAG TPA: hypothetical protein PLV82_04225 [bacterium]|nr:hypothetical protein [bacterium]
MDFSKKGLIEALKKVVTVAIYIIASMAVIGLGMYVADQSVSWETIKGAMYVGGANLVLVFLQKWLSTVDKK